MNAKEKQNINSHTVEKLAKYLNILISYLSWSFIKSNYSILVTRLKLYAILLKYRNLGIYCTGISSIQHRNGKAFNVALNIQHLMHLIYALIYSKYLPNQSWTRDNFVASWQRQRDNVIEKIPNICRSRCLNGRIATTNIDIMQK